MKEVRPPLWKDMIPGNAYRITYEDEFEEDGSKRYKQGEFILLRREGEWSEKRGDLSERPVRPPGPVRAHIVVGTPESSSYISILWKNVIRADQLPHSRAVLTSVNQKMEGSFPKVANLVNSYAGLPTLQKPIGPLRPNNTFGGKSRRKLKLNKRRKHRTRKH